MKEDRIIERERRRAERRIEAAVERERLRAERREWKAVEKQRRKDEARLERIREKDSIKAKRKMDEAKEKQAIKLRLENEKLMARSSRRKEKSSLLSFDTSYGYKNSNQRQKAIKDARKQIEKVKTDLVMAQYGNRRLSKREREERQKALNLILQENRKLEAERNLALRKLALLTAEPEKPKEPDFDDLHTDVFGNIK